MTLRLGKFTFDTRPLVRTDCVPREDGLQQGDIAASVWAALTRRGFVGGAWRALVAASLLPIAVPSAFADEDDDDYDEDDEDDEDGASDPTGGTGTGF